MKQVVASQVVTVPKGIKIEVKARKVRVKGERGESSFAIPSLLSAGKTFRLKSIFFSEQYAKYDVLVGEGVKHVTVIA